MALPRSVRCPFSSDETISDVFLVEKLTKSRCGTSKTRPESVSILNGLFLVISSSIRDASIQLRCFPFEYARPHCDCENRAGDGSHSRGYNIRVNSWLNQRWFRRGP